VRPPFSQVSAVEVYPGEVQQNQPPEASEKQVEADEKADEATDGETQTGACRRQKPRIFDASERITAQIRSPQVSSKNEGNCVAEIECVRILDKW
jgi:hypothetical protein